MTFWTNFLNFFRPDGRPAIEAAEAPKAAPAPARPAKGGPYAKKRVRGKARKVRIERVQVRSPR